MNVVVERLNKRLIGLNRRITVLQVRVNDAKVLLGSVSGTLADLKDVREKVENAKKLWLLAEQADPSG